MAKKIQKKMFFLFGLFITMMTGLVVSYLKLSTFSKSASLVATVHADAPTCGSCSVSGGTCWTESQCTAYSAGDDGASCCSSGSDSDDSGTGACGAACDDACSGDDSGDDGACFIAGTKVLMSDLSLKNIETVEVGDIVITSEGPSIVESNKKIAHSGDLFAFNNSGNFFFTSNHPFMTEEGWKSLDPEASMKEIPDLTVLMLQVGDVLIRNESKEEIVSIEKESAEVFVYNITVSGAHNYFADSYLVHNKV